jgi:hypothetical protein
MRMKLLFAAWMVPALCAFADGMIETPAPPAPVVEQAPPAVEPAPAPEAAASAPAPEVAYVPPPPPPPAAAPPVNTGSFGGGTRQWLATQLDPAAQVASVRPVPGDVASLAYERYLKSFTHPIPEYFNRQAFVSSSGGGGSGSSGSSSSH